VRSFSFVFLYGWAVPLWAVSPQVRPDWQRLLSGRGLRGCLTIYDERSALRSVSSVTECQKGHIPASTAKIFNSLAGLEAGVLGGADHTIRWDGVRRNFPEWNRDHTLKSAMADSAIWYFQATAREVGREKMADYMKKVLYGNQNLRAGVDQWWLWGPFQITPTQQIDFLRRLSHRRLPFAPEHQRTVLELIKQESTENYDFYGRTGILKVKKVEVWWVGLVESKKEKKKVFFSLFYEPADDLYDPADFPEKYGCELSLLRQWQKEHASEKSDPDYREKEARVREEEARLGERIASTEAEKWTEAEKKEKDRLDCMKSARSKYERERAAFFGARQAIVRGVLRQLQVLSNLSLPRALPDFRDQNEWFQPSRTVVQNTRQGCG